MADINTVLEFDHSNLTSAEMQNRRAELFARMKTEYKGFDDPNLPVEILAEALALTRKLRGKTAGPPKAAGKTAGKTAPRISATDLMDTL